MRRFTQRPRCAAARGVLFGVILGAASPAWATLSQIDQTGDIIPSTATVASTVTAFPNSQGVDGATIALVANQDNGVVFLGTETFNAGQGVNAQQVAMSGFIGTIQTIRLHTYLGDLQRVPGSVQVRSSTTSTTSLSEASYETLLGNFALSQFAFTQNSIAAAGETNAPGTRYADLTVNAPVGTQSLFFDFAGADVGSRITEFQAYVPEPGSLGLLGVGAVALLRRRANRGV